MSSTAVKTDKDSAKSVPQIKARRLELDYDTDPLPKYFMADPVMSHIVATLSALFPEGEDFFVRSVRRFRDQIDDPLLKRQVAGFIGQEANHGREHRSFNAHLASLGYPSASIDRMVKRGLGFDEKHRSAEVCLAVTAALEHYTATLAEVLLTSPEARELFTAEEARELLLWHALEESEHKAVAFDVYQAVCGDQKLRVKIMNQTTVGFIFASLMHTTRSILADPHARKPKVLWSNLKDIRKSPWLTKEVRRKIRDYNRPDFHPNDHDNAELTAEWREKLFGTDGALADRLKGAPSAA